jgi:hypothetical protein
MDAHDSALDAVLTAVEGAKLEYDPSTGAYYNFERPAGRHIAAALTAAVVTHGVPASLVGEVAYPAAFSRVGCVPVELWEALAPYEVADGRLRSGATTLHLYLDFMARHDGEERVEALLARGATADLADASGDTALHVVLRKASGACRRRYAAPHGRLVRTVFDAGADDELWFDADERLALLGRTHAAARLWRALAAAGWSPRAANAAGETPLDLLRRAREHAASIRPLEDRLAALNIWDALLAETLGGEAERHPAALAAEAAVREAAERDYENELSML